MSPRYVRSGGVAVELGGGVDPTSHPGFGIFDSTTTVTMSSRVRFARVYNPIARTINRLGTLIAVSSGNIDLAIYDGDASLPANRLVSTGSVASPGTGVRRFAVTETALAVGYLWFALAANNGTFSSRALAAGDRVHLGPDVSTTQPLLSQAVFPCPATVSPPDTSFSQPVIWAEYL